MKSLYHNAPLTEAQINLNREWIKALRSGEYQQTKSVLFDGRGYCCLGVACVLAGLKMQKNPPYSQSNWGIMADNGAINSWTLTESVQEQLGFVTDIGTYNEEHTLSGDNDNGKTFKQIAKTIEKHLNQKIAEKK